ncbi:MAG: Polyketide cyclase / dehydrase and lipid transport [Conexibacter sp.]|jgi:hypothetical protein|nr:Polyketide cyclase / dehydrase and lipid transport [Conexibacter sp.]
MPSVRKQQEYDVPAEEMWDRIGDFHGFSTWHPAIPSQTAEGGPDVRELRLPDGPPIVETRLEQGPRSYTYRIDEGPLPVADYVATLSVEDRDGGSVVTWVADFQAAGASDDEAVAVIEGIFQTGLDAL